MLYHVFFSGARRDFVISRSFGRASNGVEGFLESSIDSILGLSGDDGVPPCPEEFLYVFEPSDYRLIQRGEGREGLTETTHLFPRYPLKCRDYS